jgi:HlyD family secretion protein
MEIVEASKSTSGDPRPAAQGRVTEKPFASGTAHSVPLTPRKKKRKLWIWIAVLLLIAAGVAYPIIKKKQEVVLKVQTEPVTRRNITENVLANGRIFPVLQVVINPEVSGEIIELPVKEGQFVKKGDLLLRIKPDNYIAQRNSAEASYKSSMASLSLAKANLDKAELEFQRNEGLFQNNLISSSQFLEAKTAYSVAKAQHQTAIHQTEQTKALLARLDDDLAKTTIRSPISGTVTKLKSQIGERVVGTAMMAGTEIMTVANLDEMEARVDIGEMDIVLIENGQKAKLEVDAFKEEKFSGTVYEIANASKSQGSERNQQNTQQPDAIKFEVKIKIEDKERFRPGMSVTAYIETRQRTNVLAVPIQSVTTRAPEGQNGAKAEKKGEPEEKAGADGKTPGKKDPAAKPVEVVFLVQDGKSKMVPVKRGIADDNYVEIISGLQGGEQVVSGGYKVINRELQDGKKVTVENNAGAKKEK